MAKVRSWEIWLDPKGESRFRVEVKCSVHGEFSIRLPPVVAERLSCPADVKGTTMAEVEKLFQARMHEYKNVVTAASKVIIYRIQITARIEEDGDLDAKGRMTPLLDRSEISFVEGMALSLQAAVFIRTTTTHPNATTSETYKMEDSTLPYSISRGCQELARNAGGRRGLPGGVHCMDWTAEREMFFRQMALSFEQLILKTQDLFGTPEKMLQAINSRKSLLPGGST